MMIFFCNILAHNPFLISTDTCKISTNLQLVKSYFPRLAIMKHDHDNSPFIMFILHVVKGRTPLVFLSPLDTLPI